MIIGRDFNIALKYKKNTLLRVYLPADYVLMIYESPNISLPSLKHSHTACLDPTDKYAISITPLIKPSEENKEDITDMNFWQEYEEDVKKIEFENVIERNLFYLLVEYERDWKEEKREFDISEMGQMLSGTVTRVLTEQEKMSGYNNYGWHYVISGPFPPNTESHHVSSSVKHYYSMSKEDQKKGIYNVVYREFLVDFLFPPKMSKQQLHVVWYRVDRGHDSAIRSALESVKSVKITQLLSLASMHKFFFLLLVFVYFANRFVWGKYDRLVDATAESNEIFTDEREVGYIEAMCKRKNETIVMVAVTFILMSVLKQIFVKMRERQKMKQKILKMKKD